MQMRVQPERLSVDQPSFDAHDVSINADSRHWLVNGNYVGSSSSIHYTAHELDSLMTTEEWLSLFDRNELGVTMAGNDRTVFGLIKGDVFLLYALLLLALFFACTKNTRFS